MFVFRKPARRRIGAVGLALSAVLTLGMTTTVTAHAEPAGPGVITAPAQAPGALISTAETTWRYLQDDTFPSEGDQDALSWTKAGFDDASWLTGRGTFGGKVSGGEQSADYSSTQRADTRLEMNAPGTDTRVRTYFFRTTFDLDAADLADLAELRGRIAFDDGAIVYVNGHEVFRGDVPAGSEGLSYASGATTSLDTATFTVDAEHVRAGTNVVAVEVHNDRPTSSDVWFDLTELVPLTAEEAAAKPSRVILTPTEDPYTSQYVTFQGATVEDTAGRIQYRPKAGGATKQVPAAVQPPSVGSDFRHFSGTLTGLKPATEYEYRVSSGGAWSPWRTFETADPTEKEFSYLYYGDAQIGLDSTWPKVVDAALRTAPDAVGSVHAGDLIDTASNDTQWENWFAGMETAAATTNVFAAPGNHEYSGDKLMTAWKAHFEYPHNNPNDSTIGELAQRADGDTDVARQYRAFFDHWSDFAAETVYYADYQGVRFITVNATRDTTFLTPDRLPTCDGAACPVNRRAELWTEYQAAWLDHVLQSSDAKWNVVTFHQPVYSTSSGRNEPVLREYWVPVFEKHDIDLVQMGHDHTYARGFKDSTATDVDGVTSGPVYIVANSGAKHYALESDERNVWTNNGATQVQKAARITTYQVIDVAEDTLTYRSYIAEISGTPEFYRHGERLPDDAYGVGDLWDSFTVHKTDDGRKAVVEAGVEPPEFEDLTPAPTITTDLSAETEVLPGERVSLHVQATGEGELTYRWQERRPGGDWTDIDGATRTRLDLGRVIGEDFGTSYRVVVTAGTKSTVSTATTLVDRTAAPVFERNLPATTAVSSGADVTFRVSATSDGPVRYRWQRHTGGRWVDLVGRTGDRLVLRDVRSNGRYRAVAVAGSYEVPSRATLVKVSKRPATVRVVKASLKAGRKPVVKVRASVAGTAKVRVKVGKRTWTRTVSLPAKRTVTVRFGPALPRKAKGKGKVVVRLTPRSVDHAVANATASTVKVKTGRARSRR